MEQVNKPKKSSIEDLKLEVISKQKSLKEIDLKLESISIDDAEGNIILLKKSRQLNKDINELTIKINNHQNGSAPTCFNESLLSNFQPIPQIDIKISSVYEFDFTYKAKINLKEIPPTNKSEDVFNLLLLLWSEKIDFIEESLILFLNIENRITAYYWLSKGSQRSTIVDNLIILQATMIANATGFILSHNHPGGNTYPSKADIQLTEQLKEASTLIGIRFIDHIILTKHEYYSFLDSGLL